MIYIVCNNDEIIRAFAVKKDAQRFLRSMRRKQSEFDYWHIHKVPYEISW